jgi:hypothetical protein
MNPSHINEKSVIHRMKRRHCPLKVQLVESLTDSCLTDTQVPTHSSRAPRLLFASLVNTVLMFHSSSECELDFMSFLLHTRSIEKKAQGPLQIFAKRSAVGARSTLKEDKKEGTTVIVQQTHISLDDISKYHEF